MTDAEPTRSPVARHLVQGLLALLLVVAVIVVTLVVVTHRDLPPHHVGKSSSPTPQNMASGGVLLTGKDGQIFAVKTPAVAIGSLKPTDTSARADRIHIVEYIDFQCPYCQRFEQTNLSHTAQLVAEGKATLEIHPIAILDRASEGTRYASRADNAAACIADSIPDAFLNVTSALYKYQPEEGTAGLTNAQLLKVLGNAGVSGTELTRCVNDETFRDWVTATTKGVVNGSFEHVAATPSAFQGTPTVFVNGARYLGSLTDAAEFDDFVAAHSAG